MSVKIPLGLKHKPIILVDYQKIDDGDDLKYYSIGKATWDNNDFSAKVWRLNQNGTWSRQCEDLPLWRALDLAKLIISSIKGVSSDLSEYVLDKEEYKKLTKYLEAEKANLSCYLDELRRLLNE